LQEALPPADLKLAEKHSKKADLILCLGTSLQITPACNLPLKAVRAGGKMVIVNLQVCFFATSCPSWMTKQKTP
jgi:mono-ADP-ribosyltransferase sirtuin 6